MSTNIHRAIVSYSNASTGEIKVRIPAKFDSNTTLDVSPIARSAVGGVWPVPTINSQIVIASDDDSFTNIFWIQVSPESATSLTAIQAQIDTKAPLLNPIFTGTPSAPLAVTTTNTTQLATTSFVQQEITALIGGAPTALNTLTELASAINNDASYATTLTTALALKAPLYAASPIGMITAYAGSTAPTNWLMCYGQTVSRTTYASLFAIISTTYNTGGEAGTDFRLPDLRGRTIAGLDNMGGTDAGRLSTANNLGTTTGAETVTLATTEIPSHGHTPTVTNNTVASAAGSSHGHTPTVTNNAVNTGNQNADHTHTFGTSGASVDHSHTTNGGGAHSHNIGLRTGPASSTHTNTNEASAGGGTYALSAGPIAGVGDHTHTTGGHSADHSHSGTTAGMNVNHFHAVTSNVAVTLSDESSHNHSVTSNVTVTNANTGGGGAHSNMQPTMTINYIILAGA